MDVLPPVPPATPVPPRPTAVSFVDVKCLPNDELPTADRNSSVIFSDNRNAMIMSIAAVSDCYVWVWMQRFCLYFLLKRTRDVDYTMYGIMLLLPLRSTFILFYRSSFFSTYFYYYNTNTYDARACTHRTHIDTQGTRHTHTDLAWLGWRGVWHSVTNSKLLFSMRGAIYVRQNLRFHWRYCLFCVDSSPVQRVTEAAAAEKKWDDERINEGKNDYTNR